MSIISSFGNSQLTSTINNSGLGQIILSADEQSYIIASCDNGRVIQTNLDGTSSSVLFTLNVSLFPFNNNNLIIGITYNPSKTKFIIVIAGYVSFPSGINYVVELNLDGTNPIVKMDDNTVVSGTSQKALACSQCITLTADQKFYLITMYAPYINNTWNIIKVPVNDMSNPTIFATGSMFSRGVSPSQLAYTPNGNFIYPSYDGNSIYTMNSFGNNVAVLYTASNLGVSLPWGPQGILQIKDGSGYLVTSYDAKNIIKLNVVPPGAPLLPTSGPISFSQIRTEMNSGNSGVITMSSLYSNGTLGARGVTGIPASGALSFSVFLGKRGNPVPSGLIAKYSGDSWNGTTLVDETGSNYHSTATRGTINTTTEVNTTLKMIYGGTTAGIQFPTGILPSPYTILSIARYNGSNRLRIIEGINNNWLSGHWGGQTCVAYHEGWVTSYVSPNPIGTAWVLSTDQLNLYRGNKTTYGTSGGTQNCRLSIHYGFGTYSNSEVSDWAVYAILVYNRQLNSTEYTAVENYLSGLYGI